MRPSVRQPMMRAFGAGSLTGPIGHTSVRSSGRVACQYPSDDPTLPWEEFVEAGDLCQLLIEAVIVLDHVLATLNDG